jgi:hypothetical protein
MPGHEGEAWARAIVAVTISKFILELNFEKLSHVRARIHGNGPSTDFFLDACMGSCSESASTSSNV